MTKVTVQRLALEYVILVGRNCGMAYSGQVDLLLQVSKRHHNHGLVPFSKLFMRRDVTRIILPIALFKAALLIVDGQ